MNAQFLAEIDWQQPWLKDLRSIASPFLQVNDWVAALNAAAVAQALCNHRALPIRFVPQSELPADTSYEAFISATGKVPTRYNLHDFFNALVWLAFPHTKVQLNALQAAEIAGAAIAGQSDKARVPVRGKLRDAATIFDENAALLVTRDMTLVDALRDHRWAEVFLNRRPAFERDCEVHLFGHALMEKLVSPYKAITAHAWVLIADDAYFAAPNLHRRTWIDQVLAKKLAAGLSTSDFTPLPVLGLPGWYSQQDDAFYETLDYVYIYLHMNILSYIVRRIFCMQNIS